MTDVHTNREEVEDGEPHIKRRRRRTRENTARLCFSFRTRKLAENTPRSAGGRLGERIPPRRRPTDLKPFIYGGYTQYIICIYRSHMSSTDFYCYLLHAVPLVVDDVCMYFSFSLHIVL